MGEGVIGSGWGGEESRNARLIIINLPDSYATKHIFIFTYRNKDGHWDSGGNDAAGVRDFLLFLQQQQHSLYTLSRKGRPITTVP